MALKIIGRLSVMVLLGITGCTSIGPGTVPGDRVDYITAVADSWKEQALLNIVRLRYGDAPTFIEVSSMISSYTLQGQVTAAGQISSDRTTTIPSGLATVGGNATYVDRPTITYTPLVCGFRSKAAGDSDPFQPLIPTQPSH